MSKIIKMSADQIELLDILNSLEPQAQKWVWVMTELEAIGDVSSAWPAGMLDLEQQTIVQPKGVQFSGPQLWEFARQVQQVIHLSLAAYTASDVIPDAGMEDNMSQMKFTTCITWIEMFDSSYWQVYSSSSKPLHRLIDLEKPPVAA